MAERDVPILQARWLFPFESGSGLASETDTTMTDTTDAFSRLPGLFRAWDLQFLINRTDDYQVHYVEMTEGGTPLFALYRREPSANGAEVA